MWKTIQNKCVTYNAAKFKIKCSPSGNWFTKKWDNKDLKLQCEKLVNLKYLHTEKLVHFQIVEKIWNWLIRDAIEYFITTLRLPRCNSGRESSNLQDTKLKRKRSNATEGWQRMSMIYKTQSVEIKTCLKFFNFYFASTPVAVTLLFFFNRKKFFRTPKNYFHFSFNRAQ